MLVTASPERGRNGEVMSFGQWYLRRGRIGRQTWWLHYCLPLTGLFLLAAFADTVLGYPGLLPGDPGEPFARTGGPLELAIMVVMTVPSISSTVARLHDAGLTARWLWWWFVPVLGCLVTFVQNGFFRGDAGPNQYGPPPGATEPVYA